MRQKLVQKKLDEYLIPAPVNYKSVFEDIVKKVAKNPESCFNEVGAVLKTNFSGYFTYVFPFLNDRENEKNTYIGVYDDKKDVSAVVQWKDEYLGPHSMFRSEHPGHTGFSCSFVVRKGQFFGIENGAKIKYDIRNLLPGYDDKRPKPVFYDSIRKTVPNK